MPGFHMAQLNLARLQFPKGSAEVAEFFDNLDKVNAIAEASPGFIWRLKDDAVADALGFELFGDDVVVNLSVWENARDLANFVYRSNHAHFLARRREWFVHEPQAMLVLWPVAAGHLPDLHEANHRLQSFRVNGPDANAFGFKDALAQKP